MTLSDRHYLTCIVYVLNAVYSDHSHCIFLDPFPLLLHHEMLQLLHLLLFLTKASSLLTIFEKLHICHAAIFITGNLDGEITITVTEHLV